MMSEGKRRFCRVIFGGEAVASLLLFCYQGAHTEDAGFPWRLLLCLSAFASSSAAFLLVGRCP